MKQFVSMSRKSRVHKSHPSRPSRHRGMVLVWTAIVLMVLIGFVGLSIDWGKLAWNVHQLQNAADASALAGAQIVKIESAERTRQRARELGLANTAETLEVTLRTTEQPHPFGTTPDDDYDIILGRWLSQRREFFPTLNTPDAVRVIARREEGLANAPALAMLFGPIFGTPTANARREAVGWSNEISGAGLIILKEYPDDGHPNNPKPIPGLYIGGGGTAGGIEVIGGSIHVNTRYDGTAGSNARYAVEVDGGASQVNCGRLTVCGQTDPSIPWESLWDEPFDISEGPGIPYLPDPLLNLIPPDLPRDAGGNLEVASDELITNGTIDPGYYPRGIEVKTGNAVTMNPGIYFLGGGTNPNLNQRGGLIADGGTLTAHGVMIYVTKDEVNADGQWGRVNVGANAVMDITPRGDHENFYENEERVIHGALGISIWQDRDNPTEARIGGGGGMMIDGTLYFPNNHVILAGHPGKAGNQIFCGSLQLAGRSRIEVNYDGRNNMSSGKAVIAR